MGWWVGGGRRAAGGAWCVFTPHLASLHLASSPLTSVPWPICCETDAMLDPPAPGFINAHPNMLFKISIVEMPSFQMHYPDGNSDMEGQMYPPGRVQPMLREVWKRFGEMPDGEVCTVRGRVRPAAHASSLWLD